MHFFPSRRPFLPILRRSLLPLALAALAATASASDDCRMAFDMGSSGIRAGTSVNSTTARVDIDYLGPLWAGRGLEGTLPPTITALKDLGDMVAPQPDCPRVGGGFSAWRLALEQDPGRLAADLARIRTASGVAVLVIPQAVEGAYGHLGARQVLGKGLATSHVLDIGGGSLQIAGENTSFGAALGQKIWHRHLCREIKGTASSPCTLQPMSGEELAAARALLAEKLKDLPAALAGPVTMTAISRPVTRGVVPAVRRLEGEGAGKPALKAAALGRAIEKIAPQSLQATAARVGSSPKFAAYLLSDMLLVEGLLKATGGSELTLAELDLTNLPGLLADDRAYAWSRHYGCYLVRLGRLGLDAYASDPATCPKD